MRDQKRRSKHLDRASNVVILVEIGIPSALVSPAPSKLPLLLSALLRGISHVGHLDDRNSAFSQDILVDDVSNSSSRARFRVEL